MNFNNNNNNILNFDKKKNHDVQSHISFMIAIFSLSFSQYKLWSKSLPSIIESKDLWVAKFCLACEKINGPICLDNYESYKNKTKR